MTAPVALSDAETRLHSDHRGELRLWLRLLSCTNLIEAEIRTRLRERFGATLPRFDLLAQLERAPDGLTLGDLSRRMMVSNGNVTGLVERLVDSGQIERLPHPDDRRMTVVRLTAAGHADFAAMAGEHAGWVGGLFAAMDTADQSRLLTLLETLRQSVRQSVRARSHPP